MHTQFDLKATLSQTHSRFQTTTGIAPLGNMEETFSCIQLSGIGDQAVFDLSDLTNAVRQTELVLELEELHDQADKAFAYEIWLDDTLLTVRTMEPLSSALSPFFCRIPAQACPVSVLTLRNISSAPVRFSAMYLHSDLSALTDNYLTDMDIGMCFPKFTFTDQEADCALMQKMARDTADLKHFQFSAGIEIPYMRYNDAELTRRFAYALELAGDAGVGLIFNFNTWWDSTPSCRDGHGGYLNDAEYQQVVYDPKTGNRSLSIPNLWRNTPWLTMNHPVLNLIRKKRLETAMDILLRVHAEYHCMHGSAPVYRILIDNEPTYWSQYAYCQSPECGGDFNAHCVQAAQRDGVSLTMDGPLSRPQREWLIQNLSSYISDLSETFHRSATREYQITQNGSTHYGDHFLAENVFSHMQPYSSYPLADDRHYHWQTHVTPHARLGIEVSGYQDTRILSYASATGRWAQVNAERCCYTDPGFHHQIYAYGAACDIIFNSYYDQDISHLHLLDELDNVKLPAIEYGRPIMHYCSYTRELTGAQIVEQRNMEIAPLRERWVLRPAQLGSGSILFHIDPTTASNGGWLELLCLSRPDNGTICIEAGMTPEQLHPVQTLPEHDADHLHIPLKVSLNDKLLSSPTGFYLKISMVMRYYDDWAQMNAIWNIRVVAAFTKHIPETEPFHLTEYRALSTMVCLRRDCRRLLSLFPDAQTSEIETLLQAGAYRSAYDQIMHQISVLNSIPYVAEATPAPEAGRTVIGTFLRYQADTNTLVFCTHNTAYSHWQDHLSLPCMPDIPVFLSASPVAGKMLEHISTNPYTPAAIVNARIDPNPTVFSLRAGDLVELYIDQNAIHQIRAIRGLARGKLIALEPMTLTAPMHNCRITVETAPGETHQFELGMQTALNYTGAPASHAMLCGESTLNLDLGSTVLVSFEPEHVAARPCRALEITIV